jgi:hypothetical protein
VRSKARHLLPQGEKGSSAVRRYPDLASAPSIIATAFGKPYTATNDPKRGPFSWPSSTW